MSRLVRMLVPVICLVAAMAFADETGYGPGNVVYDVSAPDTESVHGILDRISLLQNLYGNDPFEASIVVVLHEGAIPFFSRALAEEDPSLSDRARDLTLTGVIDFRLCRASAQMQGYKDEDFPDFLTLVPMADAEIVRLQQAGYAYIR